MYNVLQSGHMRILLTVKNEGKKWMTECVCLCPQHKTEKNRLIQMEVDFLD